MKKKILILLVILAAGGAAVWYYLRPTVESDTITAYGNVDIRSIDLAFRVGGRLLEMSPQEGDAVKGGELLARLDAEPYRLDLAAAEASLAAAEAKLQLTRRGYRAEDIAQAQANRDSAESALTNAQLYFNRQATLRKENVVPQSAYDDAKAKRDEASASLRAATENLRRLQVGFRPEELAEAEAAFAQAGAMRDQAALRLKDTELYAPADAVVLTRVVEPGSMLSAGGTVYTLSLTRPVWVRAFINEKQLGQVQPGAEATIFADSWPGKPYRATVGYISPQAEFTPKNVETPDLRTSLVYRIRLNVTDPDDNLRQGMPVTVSLKKSVR